MAAGFKKGTVLAKAGLGSQAYTGIGFQPVALILWGTSQTAPGYTTGVSWSMGFADGTNQWFVSMGADNGGASSASGRITKSGSCLMLITSGAVNYEATLVSFDADGFTLNCLQTGSSSQYIIHYVAFGSALVHSAFVGNLNPPAATGLQSYTSVGFQGDLALFIGNKKTNADGLVSQGAFMLGAASSSSACGVVATDIVTAQNPTSDHSVWDNAEAIHYTDPGTGDANVADFSGFTSNGFQLNWTTVDGWTNNDIPHLVLRMAAGKSVAVGNETQPNSATSRATTGVGLTPQALMAFWHAADNSTTPATFASANAGISVGAYDGTSLGCCMVGDKNGVTPAANLSRNVSTKILSAATDPASATTTSEADVGSLDLDGFTLDWTTADATLRSFTWIAFGASPPGVQVMIPMGMLGTGRI